MNCGLKKLLSLVETSFNYVWKGEHLIITSFVITMAMINEKREYIINKKIVTL